ncbi:MAG: FtsX-like permease family protein [bacterium]|nr:FtsX-like permease family protein [bacterium]
MSRWRAILASVLRESRAARGRLVFFTACLAIGVAAVVGISALVAAVDGGMREQSRDLLAADLRISARRPLPDALQTSFAAVPHVRADVRELAAMARATSRSDAEDTSGTTRLVELKVVEPTYPLYGELVLAPAQCTTADLAEGTVFVGPELVAGLGVHVGDELDIGGAHFRIAAEIVDEPDRLDFALTLGPRVFMSFEGLARTELGAGHNRVRYRAGYRLPGMGRGELTALVERLRTELQDPSYLQFRTRDNAQPSVRRALGRVENYLGLVALLSLLLGGIGVSQIVRAWLSGRTQSVAVLRCLGLRARQIAGMYLGHVALLAVAGCVVGGALGAALPPLVRVLAPELFQGSEAHLWQPLAIVRGVGLGLFVATVFSLPPLTAVWRVSPAAVLRAEAVPLPVPLVVRVGAPLVLVLSVLLSARVQGGTWWTAASFSGGLLLLVALLYAGARGATALSGRLPRGRFGPYVEHGLAALARPGAGTTGAIVALGLGVMVVVAMILIEGQLDEALRTALPEEAPSVFIVDVQPDQWDGVRGTLDTRGAEAIDSVPVVMARLRAIDGRAVSELATEARADRRATWVYTREQRLTWLTELPADNEVTAGAPDGELWSLSGTDEVSLEVDFADDLGVGLGSRLRFDVQGVPIELTVTSLREVDWQSFGINFFLVVEPGVLEEAPHFRIAAARLEPPAAEFALQSELASAYPNVTMLRVRPILEKIANAMTRIAAFVRALGGFTIAAGLVILAGAVATTATSRAREAALLKSLGVTRAGVTCLFAIEYALGGLVAGAIGATGALVLAWAFLEYLLELDADVRLAAVPLGALAAAVLASASGLSASLRALRARPMETLRG